MKGVKEFAGCDPERVWSQHVSARTPCKLLQLPSELSSLSQLVSLKSLKQQVSETVTVEKRAEKGREFGNGQKRTMKLQKFLKKLSQGDTDLYLTTQEAPEASDGFPELLTVPLKGLVSKGLPVRPSLMGNLVPQAINLWMGCSSNGSSSGLHHDFHDNLYVLLRGRKRFRLYPPSTAENMYTHGKVSKVHENGRIVYQGQGKVHADGSDEADLFRWNLKRRVDAALTTNNQQGVSSKTARRSCVTKENMHASAITVAEKGHNAPNSTQIEESEGSKGGSDIEDALEAALDAAAGGGVGFSSEEEWRSDSDSGDAERRNAACSLDGLEEATLMRSRGSGHGHQDVGTVRCSMTKKKKKKPLKVAPPVDGLSKQPGKEDDTTPYSFSQVDLTLPEEEIKRRFPRFPGLGQAIEVEVEAGQALYLPASWFHEVTSFGGGDNCMHVAVNYWFHPPDRINSLDGPTHGLRTNAKSATDLSKGFEDVAPPRKGKRKRRNMSTTADLDEDAVGEKAEQTCSAMNFPYRTDFWPCMWNNRVDKCSWPQHLKVPLSGCQ